MEQIPTMATLRLTKNEHVTYTAACEAFRVEHKLPEPFDYICYANALSERLIMDPLHHSTTRFRQASVVRTYMSN